MIKCSKCGEELNEGAKFCMECGAPVLQEKECSQCGAKLPLNAKFCFECGSSQEIEESVEEDASTDCTVVAKDKEHLKKLIDEAIAKDGLECDLNFIDVSHVKDMSSLFSWGQDHQRYNFNGDISLWDVSNVKNMSAMFHGSEFNGYIGEWDVSNVTDMSEMFGQSKFDGDISEWNVSSVKTMREMFEESFFNDDISQWNVSNVTDMYSMFLNSQSDFLYGFDGWDVSNVKNMNSMFRNCTFSDCEMICESLNQWKVPDSASKSGMFIGSTLEEEGLYPTWYTDESASKSEKNSDWFDAGDLSVFETSSPHIVDVEGSNFGEQSAEEIDLSEDDEE